jgi:hypothetical protein
MLIPLRAAVLAALACLPAADVVRFDPVRTPDLVIGATLTNAWADVNGDGRPDLFVGLNGAPNRLYVRSATGYEERAASFGVADARATRAAAFGDMNNDGRPDLMLGFAPGRESVLKLYVSTDSGFRDRTVVAGLQLDSAGVRQLAWIDLDGDADLDLFVALRDRPNRLYRNEGGRFTDVAPALGLADTRKSVGAVWFDMDNDGDLDLAVANQDGDANGLFRNDGATFTDVAEAAGVAWGGRQPRLATNGSVRPCAADVNGDGRQDLFFANYGANGLFLNRGDGRFDDASAAWGVAMDARWDACAFADMDHDGDLDLYVNGTVTGGVSYRDYLYRNSGSGFVDVTPDSLAAAPADHGVQWADADGDGDLDLALTGVAAAPMPLLWHNQLDARTAALSMQVTVTDVTGRRRFPGATVSLFRAGQRLSPAVITDAGSGYNAQSVLNAHLARPVGPFDLRVVVPNAGRADTVVIRRADRLPRRQPIRVVVPVRRRAR